MATSGIVRSGPYRGHFWWTEEFMGKQAETLFSGWRTVWLEDENLHWAIRDVRVENLQ